MLKNIWKDPVGSNVIAGLIVALLTFLFPIVYSFISDKSIKDSTLFLWNLDIKLGWAILVLFSLILLVAFLKKIRSKYNNEIERMEEQFHKENSKFVDNEKKLTFRFNAYINEFNNYPFIQELRIYCNNHETEILMSDTNGCDRKGCVHYQKRYDINKIKELIETGLLCKWGKMKSK